MPSTTKLKLGTGTHLVVASWLDVAYYSVNGTCCSCFFLGFTPLFLGCWVGGLIAGWFDQIGIRQISVQLELELD